MVQYGPPQVAGVREGEVLAGRYRVDKVLGVGGMGVVVAARHVQLDTKVAIKFLLPAFSVNPEAVARFAREARAASKITSEYVARVFDVGTLDTGAPYLVMEFLDGEDLAEWLRQRGPLPIEQAVEFVLQACVAVADAHGLGIVHRDLKPANLFCVRRSDGQWIIKVLDFGISKMTDYAAVAGPRGVVTDTSAVMGSPLYMSPEQMRSAKEVNAQTDIWALGVILFEFLAGRVPFEGENFAEILLKVASQPPTPIRDFRPDVPLGLEAVILKCLEKERGSRYANVAELAIALVPFGPRRSKASAERISGIIQAAGLSPSALLLPPSPRAQETIAASGTIAPLGRTTAGLSSTARRRMVFAAILCALGVLTVAGFVGIRTLAKQGAQQTERPPTTSVVRTTAPVSPSSDTTPKPIDPTPVVVPPPHPPPVASTALKGPTANPPAIKPVPTSTPALTAASSAPAASSPRRPQPQAVTSDDPLFKLKVKP